jgi:hypothetical protein
MAYVYLDSVLYRANITNGQYHIFITKCINATWQANVWAVDYSLLAESEKAVVTVESGENKLPVIKVCNTRLAEYVQIDYDGHSYTYSSSDYQSKISDTVFSGISFSFLLVNNYDSMNVPKPSFSFYVDLLSYADNKCSASPMDLVIDQKRVSFDSSGQKVDCVFTNWGTKKGDILEGSFSSVASNTSPAKAVKFSFRIKR